MQLHSILVAEYWVLAGWDAITSMGVMQLHSRLLVEGLIDAFKSIYLIFVGEAAITSMALIKLHSILITLLGSCWVYSKVYM